jgi:hypothetical protein
MNQTLWTGIAALSVAGAVRAIKSGKAPAWIPKRALPCFALVFGGISAALNARVNGVDWETATASGVAATLLAVFGRGALRAVPGVTRLFTLLPLVFLISSCTPDARRALVEQGFDTLQCAVANMHLPRAQIAIQCAIRATDLDRILRILGEGQRSAPPEPEAQGDEARARAANAR